MSTIYTVYKADYSVDSSHPQVSSLSVVFDQGNPTYEVNQLVTADNKFERIVHRSLDHLYYRDFYINNKASFGSGNINKQDRSLEDQAWVISVPQTKFGEAIMPSSLIIDVDYSILIESGSYSGSIYDTSQGVVDDGFGNLIFSGSSFYTPYGQIVGGVDTDYTSSITKPLVGEWPNNAVYKYLNNGITSVTSSFCKGLWPLQAQYSNVQAKYLSSSADYAIGGLDFLGAAWHFTSSLNSNIKLKAEEVKEYNQKYNFQNSEFTIAMVVVPTQLPASTSGSVLIAKQGLSEELGVDAAGNIFTENVVNKYPYKLIHKAVTGSLRFEVSDGRQIFSIEDNNTLPLNEPTSVAITKVGSNYKMFLYTPTLGMIQKSGSSVLMDKDTVTLADVVIGSNYDGTSGFNGAIDNIKIYNKAFSENDFKIFYNTLGIGNLRVGDVYYNHGMAVITSIPLRKAGISSVNFRGTHTIWETEISCTVGPGEFGMSCNPSTQEFSSTYNEFVYRGFVTGSDFKPYVTSIGLYDDFGNLLAIGKLSTPIQTANNTNTTFIIRYDK